MSSELLNKMKAVQKNLKINDNLNILSKFETLTDEEIAMVLALRAKELRIKEGLTQKEFSKNLELSATSTYSNFEQKGTISFINFIKIVREFGLLEQLEEIFKPKELKEVLKIYEGKTSKNKRVRHKKQEEEN